MDVSAALGDGMRSDLLRRAILCAALLGLWALYLARLSPSVGVGDSGEFITGAATLSLPHAPSYPLFSLLGKAFLTLVPFGNIAYRLSLMSAFFNLLSAALIFGLSLRMGLSRLAGVAAAALAAGAPAFFHNGLVTEVFALNAFLSLLFWGAALLPGPAGGILAAFVLGLGMGNHQTILFAAPGVAVLLWRAWKIGGRRWPEWKRAAPLVVCSLALGLSIYLFLPARSPQNPPLNWGHPRGVEGVLRSFLRKDYGTLSLALGDQPARSPSTVARQSARYFTDGLRDQFSWPGVVMIVLGFCIAWKRERVLALSLLMVWFSAGPFFAWLGNLPFDAQSNGVLERFYVLPAVFAVFGAGFFVDALWRRQRFAGCLMLALPAFLLIRSAKAFPLRGDFLAQDYVRSVFRTLPPGTALFMDGGDDTFFTTAFQQFVQHQRTDIHLFDRGGLIFESAYGADFRPLVKNSKEARRQEVERRWMEKGSLFYSTMNSRILEGVSLSQEGFLYRTVDASRGPGQWNGTGAAIDGSMWDLYIMRSLYPPASRDYRTIALAPYFPFLHGRSLWQEGKFDTALAFYDRAWRMGPGVPWLRNNLAAEMLDNAYSRLQVRDWTLAETLSRKCLAADPANITALCNLGVIAEQRGDLTAAAGWYESARTIDPHRTDVLYNLSVVRWRQGDWAQVVSLLEQVLSIQPDHAQARQYLPQARQRLVSHG